MIVCKGSTSSSEVSFTNKWKLHSLTTGVHICCGARLHTFFIFHFMSQCCLCRSLCWFVKTPGTGHVLHSRIAATKDLFHRRSACLCKVLSLERNFTFLRTSLLVCKFVYNFMMISVKHSICNSEAWQFDFTDSFVFDFFFLNWECSHARKS